MMTETQAARFRARLDAGELPALPPACRKWLSLASRDRTMLELLGCHAGGPTVSRAWRRRLERMGLVDPATGERTEVGREYYRRYGLREPALMISPGW